MRQLVLALLIVVPPLDSRSALARDKQDESAPEWIWLGDKARDNQAVWFRKTFKLDEAAEAVVQGTCDNAMEVFVNGESIAQSDAWETPIAANAGRLLKAGANVIAVRARNTGGPAGLVLRLTVKGRPPVVTDATWRASEKATKGWTSADFDDAAWAQATVVGKLGGAPWNAVDAKALAAARALPPAEATPVARMKVPKDFKVELLYSVPRETQGSWVNLAVDPKGRLITSDQYGKLYRVTTGENPVRVEPIDLPVGQAHGLLCAFGSLYVMVGEGGFKGNGLYRVRDTDDDDRYDSVELLTRLEGGGEHGPHAILPHTDGKSLTVVCGNHTKLPPIAGSLVPRAWSEDHLVPRLWDPNGHAVGILAPGGYVCRVDPDGKKWELMCAGFRNEFDAAYNREGDLFTFDADMEWDVNLPWYRPTRVCHVVSGGEFGWRSGSGKWPSYYPDSLPPVVDIGPGSPAGVAFGTGAKFPARWQDALFIGDWSYGKLYAVHLQPTGSSYVGTAEEFITGLPLPIADMVVNPADGAMYFAIGGRKVKSALYRVTYVGSESTAPSKAPLPGADARALRRKLERFHGQRDADAVDAAWPHLGHADRFVRFAARVALEHQPAADWKERALAEKDPRAALAALLALARVGERSLRSALLEALGRLDWAKLDEAHRLELLRVYALVLVRMGRPDDLVARFDALYPAASRPLNVELCQLLVHLEAPSAAAKTMELLAKAATQEEQIRYAYALRALTAGWTPELRDAYFKWFQRAAHYKGGHSHAGFVRKIRADAAAKLPEEERERLKPILEARPPAPPAFAALTGDRRERAWTVDELAPVVEKGLRGRSFERGRELFGAVGCFKCHSFAGEGGTTGPDLTRVASRFNARDLLESIIEPSKAISDQYAAVILKLDDGETVYGRIVDLAGDRLVINTDAADPDARRSLDARRVAGMKASAVSVMPEKLLALLREDEIQDLVAYLLSGGDRGHGMFKPR